MSADNEPLRAYQSHLSEEFAEKSKALFDGLVSASGVDAESNRATIARLRSLEYALAGSCSKRSLWRIAQVLLIVAIVAGFLVMFAAIGMATQAQGSQPSKPVTAIATGATGFFAAVGFIWLLLRKVHPRLRVLTELVGDQSAAIEAAKSEAQMQMAPLNRRFDWDMSLRIIQEVLPEVRIDPYFTIARLEDFRRNYGWSDAFHTDKSILHAISGTLHGNPFVLVETRVFSWGKRTYSGTKSISWTTTEMYTDAKGKLRTREVTKHTTLYASLEKDFPQYATDKRLIFGTASAPDLSFQRTPSSIDAAGSGIVHRWQFRGEVRRLREEARRDLKRVLVSNLEFEVYFGAHDRNHPQQFRLLFTPLAQEQLVKLLRDRKSGFGDSFNFAKSGCINTIRCRHMADFDFVDHPARFVDIELEAARRRFLDHSKEYFRRFYFSIAPFLAIPLYCERHAPPLETSGENQRISCFWEHEAVANYRGMDQFQHRDCVTQSLLHARLESRGTVHVTAKGFRRVERTTSVEVFGPDGKFHKVPVHWDEYLPVEKVTVMQVREAPKLTAENHALRLQKGDDWAEARRSARDARGPVEFRRRMLSWIPK